MRIFARLPRTTAMGHGPLGAAWTLQPPTAHHPEPACRQAGVLELWWLWPFLDDDAYEHIGRGVVVES